MAKMRKMWKGSKPRHLGWLIVIVLGVCLGLTFPVVAAIWAEEPPPTNHRPERPDKPWWNQTAGYTGVSYTFWTSATDQDLDSVQYRFNWDDGHISDWTGLVPSGSSASQSHTWTSAGTYEVIAQAKDEHGATSLNWSVSLPVVISTPTTNDDSNTKELGVEWVKDYPENWLDSEQADQTAEQFLRTTLDWTRIFDYGWGYSRETGDNYSSRAIHFKKQWDNEYVDNVDFAVYCGHANENLFTFCSGDPKAPVVEAVHWYDVSWGEKDLEWILMNACSILSDHAGHDVFNYWGWPVFRGLHAILGFKSDAPIYKHPDRDVVTVYLGDYMTGRLGSSYSIIESWKRATLGEYYLPTNAAYLTEWHDTDDYLPGYEPVGQPVGPDVNPPTVLMYENWEC